MVFRDVSDRRERERERERLLASEQAARAEAEEADRAKSQFLAVLSHELRTPLNPVLMAVTALLEALPPPEEVRPTLEMIRHYTLLEARLIDDLLDVMRIVRGKMPLHWEVADAHHLIRQSMDICRSEVNGKRLHITADLLAENHHLNADPARLQQVFWNLIKNAVKFTPPGGSIVIRTRNAPDSPGGDGRLLIEVVDSGIGISPDVLPHVFEPFHQGGAAVTRQFGGMGLGLAISRGIVEAHGGHLSAESTGRDQGTTLRLSLPALSHTATRPSDEPPGSPADLAPRTPLRILLVEDEETTLKLMARLLRRQGHEIRSAGTLAEAVEASESHDFDLVSATSGCPTAAAWS